MFGRDADVARLSTLIDDARFVTVYGAVGVGKSHLSRSVARLRDRARVVPADRVTSGESANRAVLAELEAQAPSDEAAEASQARLIRALTECAPMVVVLDDVDDFEGIGEYVEGLLNAVDGLTVVTTSRRRIEVRLRHQKAEFHVEGLDSEAGRRLFEEHSRQRSDSSASVEAIDAIVRAVDGSPLAIVMAASRTRIMSPEQIAGRLADTLDVLRRGPSGLGRHDSLRSALDLSWERLQPACQTTLAGVSLFEGPFDLGAAEFVLSEHVEMPVADALEVLIDASFVKADFSEPQVQFVMSRCVRAYAAEQLEASPASDEIRGRVGAYYERFARETARGIKTRDGFIAMERLERAREPIVAEAARLNGRESRERAARLVLTLRWNFVFRSASEDELNLVDALRRAPQVPVEERAELAAMLAETRLHAGARLEAEEIALEGLKLVDDPASAAALTLQRIVCVSRQGVSAQEQSVLDDAIEAARSRADAFLEARLVERRGFLALEANAIDRAWMDFSAARETFEMLGAIAFMADSTTGLAYVEMRKRRLTEALARFDEAVKIHETAGSSFHAAAARFNLGVVQHAVGRLDAAFSNLERACEAWNRAGFIRHEVPGLFRMAMVEVERARIDEARQILSRVVHRGRQASDHHNVAMAYCERAALDYVGQRPVDLEELESMLRGVLVGADPDAFASALVTFTVVAARAGQPTLPWVNKLEELVALFTEDDEYIRDVVTHLRDLARGAHLLSHAERADGPAERRGHLARAYQTLGPILEPDAELPQNSFVRIWAARIREQTRTLDDFAPSETDRDDVLVLHREGQWYRRGDGRTVDLSTRRPLRLIIRRFARLVESGEPGLDVDELAEAGWPGEPLNLSTRRNRVYTAIRFLREMDLESVLVTDDAGYRFARDTVVRITDDVFEDHSPA